MSPEQAAAILQIPERGEELLKRFTEEDNVRKAIENVQAGFEPAVVCKLYGLPFDPDEVEEEEGEGPIKVYECRTARCRQKNKIATSFVPEDQEPVTPECPSCHQPMSFLMAVEDAEEVSHMPRTKVRAGNIKDPLSRTDKWKDGSPYEDVDE